MLDRAEGILGERILGDNPSFIVLFCCFLPAGFNLLIKFSKQQFLLCIWVWLHTDIIIKSGRRRYVYDEMKHTMAQLEVGMPELRAYEEFDFPCESLHYSIIDKY